MVLDFAEIPQKIRMRVEDQDDLLIDLAHPCLRQRKVQSSGSGKGAGVDKQSLNPHLLQLQRFLPRDLERPVPVPERDIQGAVVGLGTPNKRGRPSRKRGQGDQGEQFSKSHHGWTSGNQFLKMVINSQYTPKEMRSQSLLF